MMTRRYAANGAEVLDQGNAATVAQSLQSDFISLIAIFDRQLLNASGTGEVRTKISDARAAAERGLELTQELMELVRAAL